MSQPVLVGAENRAHLADAIHEATAQLREYAAYLTGDRMTRKRLQANDWYIRDSRRRAAIARTSARPVEAATDMWPRPVWRAGVGAHYSKSRKRLAEVPGEHEKPVVIVPECNEYKADGRWPRVEVLTLSEFLKHGAFPGS